MSCILHNHIRPGRAHSHQGPPTDKNVRPSKIELDSEWKKDVYAFTKDNLEHSAWGLAHAERDYLLAKDLAENSDLEVDDDVLFASAFLHDMGGFKPFQKDGVDHADRSAELCHLILEPTDFPKTKIESVRKAIVAHSYYTDKEPMTNEAKVLHDADCLDFLGAIGVARILSITGQEPFTPNIAASLKLIESLAQAVPGSIKSGEYAEEMAQERLSEMNAFVAQLKKESFGGEHL